MPDLATKATMPQDAKAQAYADQDALNAEAKKPGATLKNKFQKLLKFEGSIKAYQATLENKP